MKLTGLLAIIPFIGMFAGPILHNSVTPFILGLPFILAWIVIWVFIASGTMALIYWLDPARTAPEEQLP
jgi:hypothetical protein